jgi:ADP-heptose:LPS heptosyltransferase
VPGVRLISLQKHHGLDQLAALPDGLRIETLGDGFDSGPEAFLDAAAVMECVDLIVTSDTSVAHLAGALGRPVWVALQHVPDWRWLLEGETCPWYPTMRLFRQPRRGDWASVFTAIAATLSSKVSL